MIPVAHHNLLEESKIYVDDCTIEHGEQLVDILDEWDVKLFLSGHLHVQHTMRSEDNRGVWEAVTASLATPACQYGVLTCRDDGSYQYGTWSVDVESWARESMEERSGIFWNSGNFRSHSFERYFIISR